jgi:hypothetical protein
VFLIVYVLVGFYKAVYHPETPELSFSQQQRDMSYAVVRIFQSTAWLFFSYVALFNYKTYYVSQKAIEKLKILYCPDGTNNFPSSHSAL